MSHVPALRHVKEPSEFSWITDLLPNSLVIVPAFAGRGLAHLCDAWRLWIWMRELVGGKNTIGRTAALLKKPHKALFNLFLYLLKMHLQTFLSIPITQKCQILICDTLVAKWAICSFYIVIVTLDNCFNELQWRHVERRYCDAFALLQSSAFPLS